MKFCTCTTLLNPLVMLMLGLLFVGNPVPLHVTDDPDPVQPAIVMLAVLGVTPPACRSASTFGILSAQSPIPGLNAQLPLIVGIVTIEGLVIPPNELPTL